MKRLLVMAMAVLMLVACGSESPDASKDVYKIGVLQLVDHPSLDATLEGLKESLDASIGKDGYEIVFKNAQGEAVNANTMAKQFVDDKVDLIYAIATLSAQAAKKAAEGSDIPVVFNAVTDPVDAGLVTSLEAPGGNVTGVTDAAPVEKQLKLIQEMLPNVKNIGIIYNVGESNSVVQVEGTKEVAAKLGLEVVVSGISQTSELQLATQQIVEKVDAVYVITDNMVVAGISTLIDQTNKAKVPVFSAESGQFDKGILATESISYKDLGKVGGEMVKQILVDGKKPETLKVEGANETVLMVSESVAEMLGIQIPQSILNRVVAD